MMRLKMGQKSPENWLICEKSFKKGQKSMKIWLRKKNRPDFLQKWVMILMLN